MIFQREVCVKATLALAVTALAVILPGCSSRDGAALSRKGWRPPEVVDPGSTEILGVENVLSGIVQITAVDEQGVGLSRGSGVVVADRVVLTARHMTDANSWVVSNASERSSAVCVARGAGPQDDWAVPVLARSVGKAVPVLGIGRLRDLPACPEALAAGYALGIPSPTVTYGHLQGVLTTSIIRMSSPIIFGNSGGGLFVKDEGQWKLAGITVAVYASGDSPICHMGISVSLDAIRSQSGRRLD